uniref:Retrovirus-related Pol polyprotein from transposon TNT 1-94 n=1 Tax=Lygus hesperus TaxID=30085 RepID=A0A0A9WFE7_LYGHE
MVRGRGRPKLVKMTEGPGRRKKVYNMIPKTNNDTDGTNSDTYRQENTDENSSDSDDDVFEDAETGMCETACAAEVNPTEAFAGPESHEWYAAVRKEFSSLLRNKTWSLQEKPQNQKAVGCRLILCNKYKSSGELERRKARLVARGFTQEPKVDYHETYSPVVRLSSLRTVMALAVKHGMVVEQMDVETAYLNGELQENIYMEPPKHFEKILMDIVENENDDEIVETAWKMLREFKGGKKHCKLHKSLYGLKQSGIQWYLKLDGRLKAIGMTPSESDPCVYTRGKGEGAVILAVYVDDIILTSKDPEKLKILKEKMMDEFRMKDLGKIHYCLGLEFDYDFEKGKLKISQRKYINEILKRFKMETANPISTPLDVNVKFEPTEAIPSEMDKYPFRSLIGSLMYLAIGTRPDIDHAVIYLSQFNSCYTEVHWKAAKRILRYLKGTMNRKLIYSRKNEELIGYSDADWGICRIDRHSFSGFVFTLSGAAISWMSKKQRTVALSSVEAELMCISEGVKEAIIYLEKFLRELGFSMSLPIALYNDSQGAQEHLKNPAYRSRTKHIDIRNHFIKQNIQEGLIDLKYLATEDMVADFLTKPLPKSKLDFCSRHAGVIPDEFGPEGA